MARGAAANRTAHDVIDRFRGKKVCVVGDIIADVFVFGKPYRLSREAPVVVVKYEEEKVFPGSAGNTINNLLALGAQVFPVGFIGSDGPGERLMEHFRGHRTIDMDGLIRRKGETVTKTRILAGDRHTSKQQVIRIDRDTAGPVTKGERAALLERIARLGPGMDGIVVSDYGHGVVDDEVIGLVADMARDRVVVGDSRYNLKAFRGFTLITPNESEAYELAAMEEDAPIEQVGDHILRTMNLGALLITRGNKGMSLFLKDGAVRHIPISGSDEVTDVTGAGDTVCAVTALALASGADFYTASRIANYAAGVVVMKRGTATVTVAELKRVMGDLHG